MNYLYPPSLLTRFSDGNFCPARISALTCIAAVLSRKTGRTRLLLLLLFILSVVQRTTFDLPLRGVAALCRPLGRVRGVPAAGRHRLIAAQRTYGGTWAEIHPAHVSAADSKNTPAFRHLQDDKWSPEARCICAEAWIHFTHRRSVNNKAPDIESVIEGWNTWIFLKILFNDGVKRTVTIG